MKNPKFNGTIVPVWILSRRFVLAATRRMYWCIVGSSNKMISVANACVNVQVVTKETDVVKFCCFGVNLHGPS